MPLSSSRISFKLPAIAYQPRGFSPRSHNFGISPASILNDLAALRKIGFRSLVTYGAFGYLGGIPQMARSQGFDGALIMGIWDIANQEEWNNAVRQSSFVDGYCLGNEGLGIRYTPSDLQSQLTRLRQAAGKPVTTSEPIDSYLKGPYREWLLSHPDWLFPLAHPFWAQQTEPMKATEWIIARHDYLAAST